MYFPGLEKSLILGKVAEVMEKTCNFIFWSKYSVLFEIWKVIGQKYSNCRVLTSASHQRHFFIKSRKISSGTLYK